jgi:small subunit ribosomal protein S4
MAALGPERLEGYKMARDLESIVKRSRREGYALHPKAHKALVKKAANAGRGQRDGRRSKPSQYGLQLREKQKVKRLYGLLERQFSNLVNEASRQKGQSGQVLLQLLERRLDNLVYRSGFAVSRPAARQLVTHGHFNLNGRRVDVPSIRIKVGDKVELRSSSAANSYFKQIDDISPMSSDAIPAWLKVDRKKFTVEVTGLPSRDDAEPDINEQLIVEYYSR